HGAEGARGAGGRRPVGPGRRPGPLRGRGRRPRHGPGQPGRAERGAGAGRRLCARRPAQARRAFTPDAAEPNAARVVLSAPAPLLFGRWILGRDSVTVSKSATAALPGGPPSAMFSIGSRLASLDGGLANALLSGLLGSQASLTVMD